MRGSMWHRRVEDRARPDAKAVGYAVGGIAGPRGARRADDRRLATAQQQTAGQVAAVQTDVGGVKTDVAKTQSDLPTPTTS